MKYFILRLSSDPKVIGVKHGEAQSEIVKEKFKDKSNYANYINFAFPKVSKKEAWQTYGTFPKVDINLEYVQLRKDAKLTDFLSYSEYLRGGGNFLLSERAVNLIERLNLPPSKFYNVNLFQNVVFPKVGHINFVNLVQLSKKKDHEKKAFFRSPDRQYPQRI